MPSRIGARGHSVWLERDLAAPVEAMPDALVRSFGENWQYREAAKKHFSELTAEE